MKTRSKAGEGAGMEQENGMMRECDRALIVREAIWSGVIILGSVMMITTCAFIINLAIQLGLSWWPIVISSIAIILALAVAFIEVYLAIEILVETRKSTRRPS